MQNSTPIEETVSLKKLYLWCDPVPRSGYENMAADELLSRRGEAWLRFYGWAKPAVSFGYFDTSAEARNIFPGVDIEYIRRWTGGGIVDHRMGYTYTLTLPAIPGYMYPTSSNLYKWIHGALAVALAESGVKCTLLVSDAPDGGRACWASPVASDIVDESGQKLAGAGQRRYKGAVVHQGLIQQCEPDAGWKTILAAQLASEVIEVTGSAPYPGFDEDLAQLCREKYLTAEWNDESHGRRKTSHS
ncbi:MAG: hypothetical protein IKV82_05680 [Akkermansia sp.]|nr:hypothetical protein [Akkermansia sp.]